MNEAFQKEHLSEFTFQAAFPFFCLIFTLLLHNLAEYLGRISPIKVSVTVYVIIFSFITAIILYLLMGEQETSRILGRITWKDYSPHIIMFIVIPVCIFEGSFKIDSHAFTHNFWMILFLATIIFTASAVLTGFVVYTIENVYREWSGPGQWSMSVCLLFGSIVSASDPVAVLTLLHDMGAPHDLSLVIEGESLLNDGVAIVMYKVFLLFAARDAFLHDGLTKETLIDQITHLDVTIGWILLGVLLSLIIGWILASICGYLLFFTSHNSIKERSIIMTAVYITYMSCEMVHGSGVLGLVVLGVKLDRHKEKLSEDGARDNLQTWEFLAYWSNAIVFTITGLACAQFIWQRRDTYKDFLFMVVIFLVTMMVRFAVLLPCFFLSKTRCFHTLPFRYIIMMWWGGLRGTVALLLAIQLRSVDFLDKDAVRERALGYVSFCVFLSLSVQAMFSPKIASKLNLDAVSRYRNKVMTGVLKRLSHTPTRYIHDFQHTVPYFRETNWQVFRGLTEVANPYDKEGNTKKKDRTDKNSEWSTSTSEAREGEDELCHRVLVIILSCIERLKKQGILTNISYQMLSHAIRRKDDFRKFEIDKAKTSWSPGRVEFWLHSKLQPIMHRWHKFIWENDSGRCVRHWLIEDPIRKGAFWMIFQIFTPLISVMQLIRISNELTEQKHEKANEYKEDILNYRELLEMEFKKILYMMLLIVSFFVSFGKPVILNPDPNKRKLFWRLDGKLWHIIELFCFLMSVFYISSKLVTIQSCFDVYPDAVSPGVLPHFASKMCQNFVSSEYIFMIRLPRVLYGFYYVFILLYTLLEASVIREITTTMQCLYGLVSGLENFEDKLDSDTFLEEHEGISFFKHEILDKSVKTRSRANFHLIQLQAQFPGVKIRMKTQTVGIMCLKEMNETVLSIRKEGVLDHRETQLLHGEIRNKVVETLSENHPLNHLSLREALQHNYIIGGDVGRLLTECEIKELILEKDEVLFKESNQPTAVYYLLSGTMALEKTTMWHGTYVTIYPGRFVGEISGYLNIPRRATLTAMTRCRVVRFNRDKFHQVVAGAGIWLRMLAHYCYNRVIDYLMQQRKYNRYTRTQMYGLLRSEWEPVDLTGVSGRDKLWSTDSYSTVLWIEGRFTDADKGEEITTKNKEQPFEVTSRKILNPDPHQALIFLVTKKGSDENVDRVLEDVIQSIVRTATTGL